MNPSSIIKKLETHKARRADRFRWRAERISYILEHFPDSENAKQIIELLDRVRRRMAADKTR